jgi:hypothetical protein
VGRELAWAAAGAVGSLVAVTAGIATVGFTVTVIQSIFAGDGLSEEDRNYLAAIRYISRRVPVHEKHKLSIT